MMGEWRRDCWKKGGEKGKKSRVEWRVRREKGRVEWRVRRNKGGGRERGEWRKNSRVNRITLWSQICDHPNY